MIFLEYFIKLEYIYSPGREIAKASHMSEEWNDRIRAIPDGGHRGISEIKTAINTGRGDVVFVKH